MNLNYGLMDPYFAPWIFMVTINTIYIVKPLKSPKSQSWVQKKGVCVNFDSQNSFETKFINYSSIFANLII